VYNCWGSLGRSLSIYGSTDLVDLGWFFSFLIYTQSVGLHGQATACRKAATYTQNNTNTVYTHTYIHDSIGIGNHDPCVRAGEGGSYLRPRGPCDQLQVPVAVNIKVTNSWIVKLHIVMGTNISEQLAAP
jgi:hypothetical protein